MRRLILAAPVALLGLLVACGDDGPRVVAGEVVETEYDDPDRWMQCIPFGTPGKAGYNPCGTQIWHEDPPRWRLKLECGKERSWTEVSAETYSRAEVGIMWPKGTSECSVED